MPRIAHCGYILPGDNRVIDRAGWQCEAPDPDELKGRCRCAATHTHRTRDGDRYRWVALCPAHFDQAGPEAVAR